MLPMLKDVNFGKEEILNYATYLQHIYIRPDASIVLNYFLQAIKKNIISFYCYPYKIEAGTPNFLWSHLFTILITQASSVLLFI